MNGETWRIRTKKETKGEPSNSIVLAGKDSILYIYASDVGFADEIPDYAIQIIFKLKNSITTYPAGSKENYISLLHRTGDIKTWHYIGPKQKLGLPLPGWMIR